MPARAAALSDSLGIGIHIGDTADTYGDITSVISDLGFLGFKHVRDSMETNSWGIGRFEQLADAGIKLDVGVNKDPTTYQSWLDQIPNILDSVEGPNEPEFTPCTYDGGTGTAACVAIQEALYTMVQSDEDLHGIPVLNIPFAFPADTDPYSLASYASYTNVHAYPGHGRPPYGYIPPGYTPPSTEGTLPQYIAWTVDTPGLPVIMTETGYATYQDGGATTNTSQFVPEDIQARYELDAVLDNAAAGVVKTYIYELYDTGVDPNNTTNESHFGLFRADDSPKPTATAFHNLLTVLRDVGSNAAGFVQTPLLYTLSQSIAPTLATDIASYQYLMEKQDGTYELALWGEPLLWDDVHCVELSPATNTVTVTLGTSVSKIVVYDPVLGASPIAIYTNASSVDVSVQASPLVVEITP